MKIVYEDEALAVVEKPSGVLAVPGKISPDSIIARARARWPAAEGTLMVHRLDMDTSGLMMIALTRAAQSRLARQLERGEVHKRYVAVVGRALEGAGEIELWTRLDPDDRPRQVVDPVHGRRGLTRWRALSSEGATTRVELEPLTGRTHQLRIHMALGLGAPILGDRLYGDPRSAPRLMLHAARLAFAHPIDGRALVLESPAEF